MKHNIKIGSVICNKRHNSLHIIIGFHNDEDAFWRYYKYYPKNKNGIDIFYCCESAHIEVICE